MRANPLNTILDYFKNLDWEHRFYPEEESIDATYAGAAGTWQCRVIWDSQAEICSFYSFLPLTVPMERRFAMMELITRLNVGQRYGDFEFDLNTGHLALKTYILCREQALDGAVINDAIGGNLALMDDHLHLLNKMIYTDLPPMEAYEEAMRDEDSRFGAPPQRGEDDEE